MNKFRNPGQLGRPDAQAGSGQDFIQRAQAMSLKQLRQLHALWQRWTVNLRLSPRADRELRHYYVERFTRGRALETRQLTEADAARVIGWLAKLVRRARAQTANPAAGTAGRHGYPEHRRVAPDEAAWRALWGCASALGMGRPELENFIRRHYGGVGLNCLADLRSMADLNRVLWGLKAMLRRGPHRKAASQMRKRAA